MVERLIEVLDLDAADGWYAAGILPPDFDRDDWRLFRRFVELRRTQPELVAAAERELVAITGEFAAVGTGARSDQRQAGKVYFSVTTGQAPRRVRHRGNLPLVPAFAQVEQPFAQVAA